MIHPDSELRFVNPTIGYGLFATRLIPKGTFTWVRDDLDQIVPDDLAARMSIISMGSAASVVPQPSSAAN